jgi:hypothetical protein
MLFPPSDEDAYDVEPFETRGCHLSLDEDIERHIFTSVHEKAMKSTAMIGRDIREHRTFRDILAITRG